MRRTAFGVMALSLVAAGTLVLPAITQAANGTGSYAAITEDGTGNGATLTFGGTDFPGAVVTSSDSKVGVAKSATLGATTPFGESFGSSSGKQYLTAALDAGKSSGTMTITFDTPPVPGTYGIALGDVDAEEIVITATGPDGAAVSTREWLGTTFNYAGGSDLPQWDATTATIKGNGTDTQGASLYFVPGDTVKSITFEQVRKAGFPQYQVWIAADLITPSPLPTPSTSSTAIPVAPAGMVTICHRTSSKNNPYVEITVNHNSIDGKNGHDTHTGGLYPTPHWGDIIPPFAGYPGLNWPAGASILAHGCDVGGEQLEATGLLTSASPSASASASTSSSASASASASTSSSASASASATTSPTSSPTTSPSATTSATPTVSPSATPSATPTASPTPKAPTSAPEPDVTPAVTETPEVDETLPPDPTPVIVNPEGPTVIDTTDLLDPHPGDTITTVIEPDHGTADIVDGKVIYTPEPGFQGTDTVTVVITDRQGHTSLQEFTVRVGKQSRPCLALPDTLHFGVTMLKAAGAGCQPVTVTVTCSRLARSLTFDGPSLCSSTALGRDAAVQVRAGEPLGVRVTLTAKASGGRPAVHASRVYFVRS